MADCQLFFGFPLSSLPGNGLNNLQPSFLEIYIHNQNPDCLHQIEYEGEVYVGKCLGSRFDLISLESMDVHIRSILKKLIPSIGNEKVPFYVLGVA